MGESAAPGNCSASVLWPMTKPCGGGGECGANNTCICNDHYTSLGDFSLSRENPCDIYKPAVQALWGMTVLAVIYTVYVAVWAAVASRNHMKLKAWRAWLLALSSLCESAILFLLALFKFIDAEKYIVGGNTLYTILNGLFLISCGATLYIALFGFLRAHSLAHLARLGPEQQAHYRKRMFWVNVVIGVSYVIVWPIMFIPLVLIEQPQKLRLIVGIHGMPLALIFLSLGAYYAPWLLHSMTKAVEETRRADVGRHAQLEKIMVKLRVMTIACAIGFPFAAIWVFLFSFWPFFTVKTSYLLPVMYSLAVTATDVAMWGAITTAASTVRRPSGTSLLAWMLRPFKRPAESSSPNVLLSPGAINKAQFPDIQLIAGHAVKPSEISEDPRTDVHEQFTMGGDMGATTHHTSHQGEVVTDQGEQTEG